MLKKTLGTVKVLRGTRVFVRADLNVPFDKADPTKISDDTRIRSVVPTIQHLRDAGARVIVASHAGRPKGEVNESMRLAPMGERLSELLGVEVNILPECTGDIVKEATDFMLPADVVLLENVRFHKGEEKNDPAFAVELARSTGADVFVNDAFGTAHRAHASTAGIADHVKSSVGGFLMEKELQFLYGALEAPKRPFTAVVGGAKVSTKITVLKSLLDKCDTLIIGGGMIFTFYRAQGLDTGNSMVEEDFIPLAKDILDRAAEKNVRILLPTDVVIADEFAEDAHASVVDISSGIPDGWMGLDIGPDSIATFRNSLLESSTVVWNGPMGVFEFKPFSKGTFAIAETMAEVSRAGGTTVIGGGDSVAAVEQSGLADAMSHISTGGGASLELLEGKVLPGVDALDDA
jgi:phosphoglycerate kinase